MSEAKTDQFEVCVRVTTTRGGSLIPSAVMACEVASHIAQLVSAKKAIEAAEEAAAARRAAQNGRARSWFFPPRRPKPSTGLSSLPPVDHGKRLSPVSKYADGVLAGDYVTIFDPVRAMEPPDPCGERDYQRDRARLLAQGCRNGINVGYVIATFQHFGREGSPVQIALHTGVVLDKRPSDLVWIEEASGRGCDFDGDCKAGRALDDLVALLIQHDIVHYRRHVDALFHTLADSDHDSDAVSMAWETASRWGLMSGGRISAAGKTWWYAKQRLSGVEVLEDAMPVEQPSGGEPGSAVYNFNHSHIAGSSFAAGSHGTAVVNNAAKGDSADLILQVLEIVKSRKSDLKLSSGEESELDDSVEVLEEAASSPESRGAAFRTAVRSVTRLAGSLVVGAGGNGVWDAFKALAG